MGHIVKRLRVEHDYAVDPSRTIEVTNIGRATIISAHLIWKGLKVTQGSLDSVVKLQGSNNNPESKDFEDLGFQRTLDIPDGSQGLQDGTFAFEHAFIDIVNGNITEGKLVLEILAKSI